MERLCEKCRDCAAAAFLDIVAMLGITREQNRTAAVSAAGVVTVVRPDSHCQRQPPRRRRYGECDNASSPNLRHCPFLSAVAGRPSGRLDMGEGELMVIGRPG